MKFKANESANRDYLIGILAAKLKRILKNGIMLDKEVPVPYKHIYLPREALNQLEIWCFKQDICIFEELFHKTIKYRDAKIVDSDNKDILNITLEKDSSQNSHHVGLPYVIVETKMGDSINTHELLAYSEKVQMIKTIFPYTEYLVLFFGRPTAKSFRHGVNFDEIIEMHDLSDSSIDIVAKKIKSHYEKAINAVNEINR